MEPLIKTPMQAQATFQHTLENSIATPENWVDLLKTIANNHKYSFEEQVLIHAQRPDATACAEYKLWNKLNQQVSRGAVGIRLLTHMEGEIKLRYVYDISNTFVVDVSKPHFLRWELLESDHSAVEIALRKHFKTNYRYVSAKGLTKELLTIAENCMQSEFSRNCLIFILMKRCGLGTDDVLPGGSFDEISTLASDKKSLIETIEEINAAAKKILAVVEREIRERSISNDRKNFRDNERRGISVGGQHNHDRSSPTTEGGNSAKDNRYLGAEEVAISQGTSTRDAAGADDKRYPEPTPKGNRPDSHESGRYVGRTDEKTTGNNRRAESIRHDGVGGTDEQHPGQYQRDSSGGTDLQLTVEPQNNTNAQAEGRRESQKPSASSLPVQQVLSPEPYVIIKWSESKRFSDDEQLTFTEADLKFKEVEKIEREQNR